MSHVLISVLVGVFLGLGMVAPGVSGGVMAVAFGLYDKIIQAAAELIKFKNIKKNILFLLPIALGAGVVLLLLSKVISVVFLKYPVQVKMLFIGLMLGSGPAVLKEANSGKFRWQYLIPFAVLCTGMCVVASIAEPAEGIRTSGLGILEMVVSGAILAAGIIIPGTSASFVLMFLGTYQALMQAVANLDFSVLLYVGIGFILGALLLIKVVHYLFSKFHGYTYYGVLGFAVASIYALAITIPFEQIDILSILLFLIGIVAAYFCAKLEIAQDEQKELDPKREKGV